jgi:hypothetical protein
MHAEYENRDARVARPDSLDQRQAAKSVASHGQIDDHDVGPVPMIQAVAGHEILSIHD